MGPAAARYHFGGRLVTHHLYGDGCGLVARYHFGGRLVSEGEGGKGLAIPHWKDPITYH